GSTLWGPGRPFALMLVDTKGTTDARDDDYVYALGAPAPAPGEGWKRYVFDVPDERLQSVPSGWFGGYSQDPEPLRPGVTWQQVLESVDVIRFYWADPRLYYLENDYDVGVDNIVFETHPLPKLCPK